MAKDATGLDWEHDVEIDADALDVELVRQPMLYARYSMLVADAERAAGIMKDNLELCKAELDRTIRKTAEGKTTETQIKNQVIEDQKYAKANDAYIDAEHKVRILQGVVRSLDHKKTSLSDLVKLQAQGYFAGPAVPRNIGEEVKKGREEQKAVVRKRTAERTQ